MDALSKLLALTRIEGSLDLRCQMAGTFHLDHDPTAPGQAPFHLVLAGSTQLSLPGGPTMTLNAGDFAMLPRGASHAIHRSNRGRSRTAHLDNSGPLLARRNTDGAVDLDLLCGRFTYAEGSADLIMSALPNVLHVSLAQAGQLQGKPEGPLDGLGALVSLLRNEVRDLQSGAVAIVTSLSHVLFVMALRLYMQRAGMPASLLALLGDSRLSSAVLAMMKAPEKPWTVEMLAQQANMSRATFARHFNAKGAVTPLELLTTLRIQLACGFLETAHSPVGDIAAQVGYQSESAFAKVFRMRTGLTPHAFRRRKTRPITGS